MKQRVWEDFDPDWLVRLAEAQLPRQLWIARALAACRRCSKRSVAYWYFVESINPNRLGSDWQFEQNVILQDPEHGQLVLDVLRDGRIGGIEFLERLGELK